MRKSFIASNGWEVVPGGRHWSVAQELIRPDGGRTLARDVDEDDLRAFVEFAATLGITAERGSEGKARVSGHKRMRRMLADHVLSRPQGLWERILFPVMRVAYQQGFEAGYATGFIDAEHAYEERAAEAGTDKEASA